MNKFIQNNYTNLYVHSHNSQGINKIKTIKYSCCSTDTGCKNDFKIKLLETDEGSHNKNEISVELDPTDFISNPSLPLVPKNNWFVNSTNIHIPIEVSNLLQLGEGFCLPPENKEELIIEYIKYIENNFSKFKQQQACINSMRIQFFNFLKSLKKLDRFRTEIDKEILDSVHTTKKFIKNNPDILFTRADKGNIVIALDRNEYIHKMESYLRDADTYILLKNNPVRKLTHELKTLLKRWLDNKYVPHHTYSILNSTKAILPRAYGLPKIHKEGHPLRIIISSSGSPLHKLAEF